MPSYERYETHRRQTYGATSRRTAWGYWIPLAVTVTVATAGLAAWIWNERKDDDDDDESDEYTAAGPQPPSGGPFSGPPPNQGYPPPGPQGPLNEGYPPPPGSFGPDSSYPGASEQRNLEEEGIVSKVSGALRRTPSPQQLFDVASKRVTAGVVAAGAVVGGALASITEEEKGGYEDHTRWSEEADSQNGSRRTGPELRDAEAIGAEQVESKRRSSRKQKAVAIIISAETDHMYDEDADHHQEHASLLSHLPEHVDEKSRVFVLIYEPMLKQPPLTSSDKPQSMASSYSNIGHEDAQSPSTTPVGSRKFNTLYTQAQAIVEKETMIMPFSTPTAFVQMLRQLGPETVYIQANMAGTHGEHLDAIKGWVGQTVLVVGDESGHGGLVDSEDERGDDAQVKWWLEDSRIGLGKGIEVVEGLRIGEDWGRRIKGRD